MENLEHCSYSWTIENWYCRTAAEKVLESPVFSDNNKNGEVKWKLVWKWQDETDPDSCTAFLTVVSAPKSRIISKYLATFRNTYNKVLLHTENVTSFDNYNVQDQDDLCLNHVISEKLRLFFYNTYDMNNYDLNISINMSVFVVKPLLEFESPVRYHECKLAKDLSLALDDLDSFSDVSLCVGDVEIKASRFHLAARSPVLRAALKHDTLEKKSGRIEVIGFEVEIVKMLLKFIYEGHVDIVDFDTAVELLRAADIYDINDLKQTCTDFLVTILDDKNVLDILLLAEINQALELKTFAMNFFLVHPQNYDPTEFEKIMEHRPKLLTELLVKVTAQNAKYNFLFFGQ